MKPVETRNIALIDYSRTGITQRLSIQLTESLLPARVIHIEPYRHYRGLGGFLRAARESRGTKDPVVYPPKPELDLSQYDLVIVAGPVWAGHIASPLRSFIKQFGGNAKKTALMITHGGETKYDKVLDELDALLGVKRSFELSVCSIDKDTDDKVEAFAAQLLSTLEA